ncbi:DNA G:T-mismatch repair endonuclease Vsr [Geotalea daltonii FRC-32]|uniref:Very short patch repair endonuclease n=1 Tax=Geotalea daltonii (strain DSM 22248 / JCM 15807 / FRC-32) TaxID=316067 RepID=B9M103_GEODF|nr:very short patch repair endonuclease [Geotalea daltonii]ACM19073.1 DNA G:T-mismatch repair endonuclease Vsr [Geotalea daltonii FRC-32]
MADVFTSEKRSEIMRQVHGKNTSPEKAVRSMLHRMGFRFRIHRADLPGCPDIVLPARRKVIFVHGCFWHGHTCPRGSRIPKTNQTYWQTKIERNRKRDILDKKALSAQGWSVLVIWECELKDSDKLGDMLCSFLR